MPTIPQLPQAQGVDPSDKIAISQDGVARAVPVATLLASVQPAISASTGSLLGRVSLGPGGPEEVVVGDGLVLSQGTLTTAAGLLNTIAPAAAISADDRVVVRRNGELRSVPIGALRALHAAGRHVTIDADGTIAAVWPTAEDIGAGGTVDIAALPRSHALLASDLIPISRGGVGMATTYATLLNAQTIDQGPAAAPCTDSDLVWVAQDGATMVRQSFAAIWNWIAARLPNARIPVVELDSDTVLDGTVHNGRILVCTQPLRISAAVANMGSGFACEIINLAATPVTFGPGFLAASTSPALAPRRTAQVRVLALSSGTVAHLTLPGAADPSTLPGAVQSLMVTATSSASISLTWLPPSTGAPPFVYTILHRVQGTANWITGPSGLTETSGTVTALMVGTAYEFVVVASNASGTGNVSTVIGSATQGTASAPGQPLSLTALAQGTSSVALSWVAPTSGAPVTSYTIQYRTAGSSAWTGTLAGITALNAVVDGLEPGSTHEFRVVAVNGSTAGSPSAIATATTQPQGGAVTSIQWNLTPAGPYPHGSGAIGVNVFVTPSDAAVRFGFSTSATTPPATWTLGVHVMTNLWGAYVDTPPTPGTWYAWAQGTDGSATTLYPVPFTVQ